MLENVTGPGAAFHESSETTVCRVPSSYSICSLKIIFGAPYDPANLLYRSRGMLKNPLPSIAPTASSLSQSTATPVRFDESRAEFWYFS